MFIVFIVVIGFFFIKWKYFKIILYSLLNKNVDKDFIGIIGEVVDVSKDIYFLVFRKVFN